MLAWLFGKTPKQQARKAKAQRYQEEYRTRYPKREKKRRTFFLVWW